MATTFCCHAEINNYLDGIHYLDNSNEIISHMSANGQVTTLVSSSNGPNGYKIKFDYPKELDTKNINEIYNFVVKQVSKHEYSYLEIQDNVTIDQIVDLYGAHSQIAKEWTRCKLGPSAAIQLISDGNEFQLEINGNKTGGTFTDLHKLSFCT